MQDETGRRQPTNYRGWQSDVIVDLIKRYGFPHITLNPGASFRGLHDSLVNYGGNEPPMMLCQHEEIAVQIAHGYAKATGKPMAVILHDLVGLLHACMAIYYAYIDRVPIFIIGATGPMDEGKRRPHIDWTHSALVQGNAVRDYVKWDYQPTSIEGVPESFARAYSIMTTEPQGPVYMCYDAALQEAPLTSKPPLPPAGAAATPAPMAPDPRATEAIADKLLAAEHPMLLAEYAGRRAGGFESLVELAETAGAAVWDVNNALNFPNKHPLCLSMDQASLRHTDLIVGLDVNDWEKQLTKLDSAMRTREPLTPPSCDFVEIGFGEINISKWAFAHCRAQSRDRQAARRGVGKMAGRGAPELGRLTDHLRTARDRNLGGDQERRLGSHRQHAQAAGAQALGLRQAVPAPRRRTRHLDADRHFAGRGARAQGHGTRRGRHSARRRSDVRRRRALDCREIPNPNARRHAQQPRLLQRLGAPDPNGQAARDGRVEGPYRHGLVRPRARLRRACPRHGLRRRGADRQAAGRASRLVACARRSQEGAARARRHHHTAPLRRACR